MGSLCEKRTQNEIKDKETTYDSKEERQKLEVEITEKKCSDDEFEVWKQLSELKVMMIKKINQKSKSVEFFLTDLNFNEITSLSQIVLMYDKLENFFLLPKLLEILISIIDFIQSVLEIKKKYNQTQFFLIYFNKFLFFKNENNESELKYICSRLNEPFSGPELLFKHDKIFSSMSIYNSNKSFINNMKNITEDEEEPDLNSFFYSKAKDLYNKIKNSNYDFNEFEYFYSDILMNFINRFLLKKASIQVKELNHDFVSIKTLLRGSFRELRKSPLSLQKLKEFLVSIICNNIEMNNLTNKINVLLNKKNLSEVLENLISDYNSLDLEFVYGNCNTTSKKGHNFTFYYDRLKNPSLECICIRCAWSIITKKLNKDEKISLSELERQITSVSVKNNSSNINIDLFYYLHYICYLQPIHVENTHISINNRTTDFLELTRNSMGLRDFSDLLKERKDEIYISLKNEGTAVFELYYYEDNNEIFDNIMFEYKIKEIQSSKNKKIENSIIYPENIRSLDASNSVE